MDKKKLDQKHNEILLELLKQPDNKVCCDCPEKGEKAFKNNKKQQNKKQKTKNKTKNKKQKTKNKKQKTKNNLITI